MDNPSPFDRLDCNRLALDSMIENMRWYVDYKAHQLLRKIDGMLVAELRRLHNSR